MLPLLRVRIDRLGKGDLVWRLQRTARNASRQKLPTRRLTVSLWGSKFIDSPQAGGDDLLLFEIWAINPLACRQAAIAGGVREQPTWLHRKKSFEFEWKRTIIRCSIRARRKL